MVFNVFVKFLHVAAALWVSAGVFGSAVVRAQARRAATLAERIQGARMLWRLHTIYTLPGLVLVGLLGFWTVSVRGFAWGALWIAASSLLYTMMLLWTLFVVTPALARLNGTAQAAVADRAAVPQFEVAAAARLWGILSDVNALAILILVYLMVMKP